MRRVAAEAAAQSGSMAPPMEELTPEISPMLSLLLYLCSEAADYGGGPLPTNPRPVKTAKGMRLFPHPGRGCGKSGRVLGLHYGGHMRMRLKRPMGQEIAPVPARTSGGPTGTPTASGQDDRRSGSTGSRQFWSMSKTFPTCRPLSIPLKTGNSLREKN